MLSVTIPTAHLCKTQTYAQLPRMLFEFDWRPASQWTEHDHPLPFLNFLKNHIPNFPFFRSFERYELSQAARAAFLPLVTFLLDHLAGYDCCGPEGALLWAATEGFEELVQAVLAQYHVDVNSRDVFGDTLLHHAIARGHCGVAKLLLAQDGVNVNSKRNRGVTPLSRAAGTGHIEAVKLLLAQDEIDLDSKDRYGLTPLAWAATNGHPAIVEMLLEQGADTTSRDTEGQTVLFSRLREGM